MRAYSGFTADSKGQKTNVFNFRAGLTKHAGLRLSNSRSTPPESDPTKAVPHDLEGEEEESRDIPGEERKEPREYPESQRGVIEGRSRLGACWGASIVVHQS